MTRTRSMSRAAASTTSAATIQRPCNRARGPGQAKASSTRHVRPNQKDWARGVSARMTMRKRRNGLGPRMQTLREMGERDHTTDASCVCDTDTELVASFVNRSNLFLTVPLSYAAVALHLSQC